MAKVTGPLFSVGARGKFAGALVYSFWKGTNVVREYVVPANPQTGNQGDRRVMMGGLGRSVKYVQAESDYEGYAKVVAPGDQSWNSYYAKYIMATYFTSVAGYDAQVAEYLAHAVKNDFANEAVSLGLTNYNLAYKSMTNHFEQGLQLYMVAKFGCDQYLLDNTKFNVSPYSVALADWNQANVQAMVADFAP